MGIYENDLGVIVDDFEVRHMVEFEGGAWHAPPRDDRGIDIKQTPDIPGRLRAEDLASVAPDGRQGIENADRCGINGGLS